MSRGTHTSDAIGDAGQSSQNSNDGLRTSDYPDQEMLPGIPDTITVDLITPKLPWRLLFLLSPVNRGWRRAIRSRAVYDARVRSKVTETMVAMSHFVRSPSGAHAIGLYVLGDNSLMLLPPIPNTRHGIPVRCECIAVNGKVYVVGGYWDDPSIRAARSEVHVMDLGGQRPWERCKNMGCPRTGFGLGALGGKIYVFGGIDFNLHPVFTSEVYDPASDQWNPIKCRVPWRHDHRVLAIGEELVLHGGRTYNVPANHCDFGKELEVEHAYHPDMDECRELPRFEWMQDSRYAPHQNIFIFQGQVHSKSFEGIHAYDMENKSWKTRYAFSPANIGFGLIESYTLGVDDGLLLLRIYRSTEHRSLKENYGQELLHGSISFSGQRKCIIFREVELLTDIADRFSMCSIQL